MLIFYKRWLKCLICRVLHVNSAPDIIKDEALVDSRGKEVLRCKWSDLIGENQVKKQRPMLYFEAQATL